MRRAAILGLAAAAAVWVWQFLTVRYNHGGNWTALYVIAPHMPVPEFLKGENLYVFPNTQGYDGQVYHLMAHDPWMRKGSPAAIVGAAFRYQRIFVPALAWTLALGNDRWIHESYEAVMLASVFLGVYWLSRWAARAGLSPAWGLIFVIMPATITSADRMTVDVALGALAAAFAFYAENGPVWTVFLVLACAALTRETAFPIIGGYTLYLITRKRFVSAAVIAAAALPALAWYVHVASTLPKEPSTLSPALSLIPFKGFVLRLLHPVSYPLPPMLNTIAIVFNYIALAGVLLALVLAIRPKWTAHTAVLYAMAISATFVGDQAIWGDAFSFARPFTPTLILVALQDLGTRPWLALLPTFMMDSRIALNFAPQLAGVWRGLTT